MTHAWDNAATGRTQHVWMIEVLPTDTARPVCEKPVKRAQHRRGVIHPIYCPICLKFANRANSQP